MNDREAPNRQRAAELLRKLRCITVEAGATESEALNAATMARRLADQHGLPLEEDPVVEVRVELGRVRARPIDKLWGAVADFCHTSHLFHDGRPMAVAYVGRSVDVLLAEWLHVLLQRHIDKSLDAYKLQPEYRRRKPHRRRIAAAAFVDGMARKLCHRLDEMADWRTGASKIKEAELWIGRRYGTLGDMTVPKVKDGRVDGARRAGARAGADVPINAPVAAQPTIAGMLERS